MGPEDRKQAADEFLRDSQQPLASSSEGTAPRPAQSKRQLKLARKFRQGSDDDEDFVIASVDAELEAKRVAAEAVLAQVTNAKASAAAAVLTPAVAGAVAAAVEASTVGQSPRGDATATTEAVVDSNAVSPSVTSAGSAHTRSALAQDIPTAAMESASPVAAPPGVLVPAAGEDALQTRQPSTNPFILGVQAKIAAAKAQAPCDAEVNQTAGGQGPAESVAGVSTSSASPQSMTAAGTASVACAQKRKHVQLPDDNEPSHVHKAAHVEDTARASNPFLERSHLNNPSPHNQADINQRTVSPSGNLQESVLTSPSPTSTRNPVGVSTGSRSEPRIMKRITPQRVLDDTTAAAAATGKQQSPTETTNPSSPVPDPDSDSAALSEQPISPVAPVAIPWAATWAAAQTSAAKLSAATPLNPGDRANTAPGTAEASTVAALPRQHSTLPATQQQAPQPVDVMDLTLDSEDE